MGNWYSTERIAADVQREHRRAAHTARLLKQERPERARHITRLLGLPRRFVKLAHQRSARLAALIKIASQLP